MFISYENPELGANILTENIKKAEKWARKWLVKFQPTKTESLVFTRKRESVVPQIEMGNNIIKEVTEHKHLGLTLQKSGKWTEHIRETISRASKRLDILRGYMHHLNSKSLERLYITYIRPILEYSNII